MIPFRSEHNGRLPDIRIQKAVLENFKSVEHGEIVFSCGKHGMPDDGRSDILGVYGQNGSGKTTFVEVLSILKYLMSGRAVPATYADIIKKGADHANAEFTFHLRYPACAEYPEGEDRKLIYSFAIDAVPAVSDGTDALPGGDMRDHGKAPLQVRVLREQITVSGTINGEKYRLQQMIDTGTDGVPFGPGAKVRCFCTKNQANDIALLVNKKFTAQNSRSFIFSEETLKLFDADALQRDRRTPFFEMLLEMAYYAKRYLYVVDTRSTGFIRLGYAVPFISRRGVVFFEDMENDKLSPKAFEVFRSTLESMNLVLPHLIPGMNITIRKTSDIKLPDGSDGVTFQILSKRGDIELPIQCESDGVRKIISSLSLLISVYYDPSITVAIDEFDAGIYEYLLGEILEAFEESGKGQFIFTSHNLRPLEIIDKDSILFTTTNPRNRYIRLKNVGQTTNLRDVYFREILLNEQDEKLYNATKRYLINAAFTKAAQMEMEAIHGEEE